MNRCFVAAAVVWLAAATTQAAWEAAPPSAEAKSWADRQYADAQADIARGDYDAALRRLNALTRAEPGLADAWNATGYASRKLGRWQASLGAYQRALALDPRHKAANAYLGELYLQTDRLDDARGRLARLEALCPEGCDELEELRAAFAAQN